MTSLAFITSMDAAGTLTGDELFEVSQLSTSVSYTATTISAAAADNSLNDSANQFVAEGFAVNDRVQVTGFTGNVVNNIFVGTIGTIAAGKITILSPEGDVLVDDAAGESVTITKWVSRRTTLDDILATVGAVSYASTTEQLTGTEAAKSATPDTVAALWEQGSDVASAGTVSLGEGGYFNITGTTTITDIDFATDKAGRKAWVKFAGILTLTHNASTLILPTGANIATAAGDTACFVSEGSDVVRCVAYQRASGASLASSGSYITQGTHTIPVPAGAMTARTTSGAASGTTESSSNKVMTRTLDFDKDADEFAQVSIPMPKSWDEGTITVQFIWTATTTGDVIWGAQAQYQRDDDAIDGSWGSAQTVTDSVTASGDRMVSSFTSAITPAGTGGNECSLLIQVYRDADNGSDTLAADAKLIAIRVKYTINAGDDS